MKSSYGVFFRIKNKKYNILIRFPVNPEEIEETRTMAIEKYEVLNLGQIAVPTHMELREFSFEAELPKSEEYYAADSTEFNPALPWMEILDECMSGLIPVRFIFGPDENQNGLVDTYYTSDGAKKSKGDSVEVLIEELTITEKAGEEGDKYIKLKLLEYKDYGSQKASEIIVSDSIGYIKKTASNVKSNPKSTGYYVVKSGDSLWMIAKKYYGNGAKANIIYNANKDKIKNPGLLTIGWKLKIPTEDEFSKYSAALPTTKKSSDTSSAANYEQGVAGIAALLK
jgi:LysM repeat protein